jgi:hypothetical protein
MVAKVHAVGNPILPNPTHKFLIFQCFLLIKKTMLYYPYSIVSVLGAVL